MKIGALLTDDEICQFNVWAPEAESLEVVLKNESSEYYTMFRDKDGYWHASVPGVKAGDKYKYCINGGSHFPDPASHYQASDVHGASVVVDHNSFKWTDAGWKGADEDTLIIYELHTGTFTAEGTFEAAIERLDYLFELGITAIEIMPVSEFPGGRNWGYDGVYPFAPDSSYGGPEGLKKLVDAAHNKGIAVILDVVYNHFGPEGNYTNQYAPYFTDRYRTPWGDALNYDHAMSGGVRNYFIENGLHWMRNYHIDGLRLDAIDTIYDLGAKHFLRELAENVELLNKDTGKKHLLIAESDLNDEKVIRPKEQYGFGLDMQWADDFHHSLHALLTGEQSGYYMDFGTVGHLAEAYRNSFVYAGKYSHYRKRVHGNNAEGREPKQFVVCTQNHDQIGNRALGERLAHLVSFEALKLAAGSILLSPYTPLIFMGEEYAEKAPFLYFVSHTDKALNDAVNKGRKEEFKAFKWKGEIPNPSDKETFNRSKLNWNLKEEGMHRQLFNFYKKLIYLRKNNEVLRNRKREDMIVNDFEDLKLLTVHRRGSKGGELFIIHNFNNEAVTHNIEIPEGPWRKKLDSASEEWGGGGESAAEEILGTGQNITLKKESIVVYERRGK